MREGIFSPKIALFPADVTTLAYADLVMKLETFAGIPVSATLTHSTPAAHHNVSQPSRLCSEAHDDDEDDKIEPTNTFIFTFDTLNLHQNWISPCFFRLTSLSQISCTVSSASVKVTVAYHVGTCALCGKRSTLTSCV